MQEQHHALRLRMVHKHSSELHVGMEVYEADVRLPILRTRHVGTPSGHHDMEDEYNHQQLLSR